MIKNLVFGNGHVRISFRVSLYNIPLFTDNSPGEEPPATLEKEEETEECDHEGEPFNIKTEEYFLFH